MPLTLRMAPKYASRCPNGIDIGGYPILTRGIEAMIRASRSFPSYVGRKQTKCVQLSEDIAELTSKGWQAESRRCNQLAVPNGFLQLAIYC